MPPLAVPGRRQITTPPTHAPEAETQVLPADGGETEVLPVDDHAPPSSGAPTEKLQVADGVELIGRYEDSGFKEAPFIARRSDGQVVQLAPLLYLIAEAADGTRTNEEIAAAVSEAIKRGVSADNVRQLAEERLRPLGILAGAAGATPEVKKLDPLLALKFRAALVPERLVNAVTTVFKPLFFPPVVIAALAGLVALDVWLFGHHGIAQSMREVLYSPALLMLMLGLVILSAAFHECGHATACAYGGARPGVMGAGIYIVWPAFYTDVTDAYRLGKRGRLRTDLGGIYFNTIFMLALTGAYFATGWEPLLLFIPFQHLEIVHQLLPFIRLDGYYIVSDLTGVPDMFARIKPTLESLLPWRQTSDKVKELKPWVRVAVTAYVFTVIPVLLFMFSMMVINTPRILATAWDSFFVQYHKVQDAFGAGGDVITGVIGILQMLILLLPALGLVVTFWRIVQRLAVSVWKRTEGDALGRLGVAVAGATLATFLAYTWWPNGDYRPIQRGERGTIQGAINELAAVPTGRPALTPAQAARLGDAPFRSRQDPSRGRTDTPTSTDPTPTQTGTGRTPTTPTTSTTSTTAGGGGSSSQPTSSSPTPTTQTSTAPSATTPSATVTAPTPAGTVTTTTPSATVQTPPVP